MSNKHPRIKNLVFDFGGVLFPVEPYSGTPMSPEDKTVIRTIIQHIVQLHQYDLRAGTYTVDEFIKDLKSFEGVSRERRDIIIKSTCNPDTALLDLIRELKKTYTIYGLINASAGWTELRRGLHHLDDLFTRIVVSHETGFRKPLPEAFESFLKITGCRANECLFIDNDPHNTVAAEELGFSTCLYTSLDDVRRSVSR